MSGPRRRALFAAAVVAAVVAFVMWWTRQGDAGDGMTSARATPAEEAAARTTTISATEAPTLEGVGPTYERMKREYEAYVAASVYPHWSMPIGPEQVEFIAWNTAVPSEVELETGIHVRFDADRAYVFPGEAYTSWIEAWRVEDGAKQPVPFRITRAIVSVISGPEQGEAFDVTYRDDGKDGDAQASDLRYTNRFVPGEHDELSRATQTRVELYADFAGDQRIFYRDFVSAPREVIEVVGVRDELEDGSLVVTLDVEALEAGRYTFYGVLKAADGAPIAMSKLSYTLAKGRGSAELVFFGRSVRAAGAPGPYLVTEIHGLKRPEGDEGDVWWRHAAPHRTRAYRLEDLSDAEWDDPERREKIAHFERILDELAPR